MNTKSIKEQLQSLDISQLKLKNGKSIDAELTRHARILAECIQLSLKENVYDAYQPKQYKRTYALLDSIQFNVTPEWDLDDEKAGLKINIYFDERSKHLSILGNESDVEVLLNEGYQTNSSFQNVPYFGFRKGTHFIEFGIEKYREIVGNPFDIRLNIAGKTRYFD